VAAAKAVRAELNGAHLRIYLKGDEHGQRKEKKAR
jgi:hypothetical protein